MQKDDICSKPFYLGGPQDLKKMEILIPENQELVMLLPTSWEYLNRLGQLADEDKILGEVLATQYAENGNLGDAIVLALIQHIEERRRGEKKR